MSRELSYADHATVKDGEPLGHGLENALQVAAPLICRNPMTGDIVIENGKARIILQNNGTIRLEGVRIVGMASERLDLDAAVICLN